MLGVGNINKLCLQYAKSGNFISIVHLLSNYDPVLKELLLKPKGEINYLSPTIQNEIINLLGTKVRENIVMKIKKAPFLAQDLSKTDQLSVVFRYIKIKENDDLPNKIKICESFVGFISVTDCTSQEIKTEILSAIEKYGMDLSKCRGQSYDGAKVMSRVYGQTS
ncbi:hypothetical protein TNCV_811961 [Trichonephila clavipes]|nr:hypothetical protein TNCV_811961 [Trichonephila clavipes]